MPRGLKSGVWEDTEFHNRFIPSTKVCLWQRMRREYLEENGIGFFCWTLNDNNFKTGSLFTCVQWSQRTEMAHAWRLTSDKHRGPSRSVGPCIPAAATDRFRMNSSLTHVYCSV